METVIYLIDTVSSRKIISLKGRRRYKVVKKKLTKEYNLQVEEYPNRYEKQRKVISKITFTQNSIAPDTS